MSLSRTSTSSKIWDKYVGPTRDNIPWTHLPTNQVVLQRYRCIRNSSEEAGLCYTKPEFIRLCWNEVKDIWTAARIPLILDKNGMKKIGELLEWFVKVCSNKNYLHTSNASVVNRLNELFDIAPHDVEAKLKSSGNREWVTDLEFYSNQKTFPQTLLMAGQDIKTSALEARREKRKQKETMQHDREKQRATQNDDLPSSSASAQEPENKYNFWWWDVESIANDSSECDTGDSDSDVYETGLTTPKTPKTPKRPQPKPAKMTVEMDLKKIFQNTTEAAMRVKLSSAAHLEILSTFVNQCTSATTASITASLSTCKRQRTNKVKSVADQIRQKFTSPLYPTVHFDGKVVKYLSGEAHDHEAVCLSGPTQLNPQFLGAPLLEPATGENTAAVTLSILEAWNVGTDSLFASVWDTTAVNTGVDHGACACIERRKGTALLWCACRHHMAEIHMTHVFNAVRGPNKAPEDPILKRVKGIWTPYQPAVDQLTRFVWPRARRSPIYLLAVKTRDWARECMQNAVWEREDYMELLELIAAYLGLPILRHGRPVQLFMRRVGAIHHARFMAKAITLLKMALLYDKYQDNFTAEEWTQVNRLAEFVALIYGRYFLQSALSSAAPRVDIGFLGDVLSYRPINHVISTSAKGSFLNHLWYLCPELVVLAFFDTDVPNQEKSAMARTLVANQVPVRFPVGKPGGRHFEEIIPKLAAFLGGHVGIPCLSEFITERSWLFFHLVQRGTAWLARDPEEWQEDPEYRFTCEVAHAMLVVNDCAERNIKDVTDYIRFTRNVNGMLDNLILVGEDRRSLVPKLNRENLLNA